MKRNWKQVIAAAGLVVALAGTASAFMDPFSPQAQAYNQEQRELHQQRLDSQREQMNEFQNQQLERQQLEEQQRSNNLLEEQNRIMRENSN